MSLENLRGQNRLLFREYFRCRDIFILGEKCIPLVLSHYYQCYGWKPQESPGLAPLAGVCAVSAKPFTLQPTSTTYPYHMVCTLAPLPLSLEPHFRSSQRHCTHHSLLFLCLPRACPCPQCVPLAGPAAQSRSSGRWPCSKSHRDLRAGVGTALSISSSQGMTELAGTQAHPSPSCHITAPGLIEKYLPSLLDLNSNICSEHL